MFTNALIMPIFGCFNGLMTSHLPLDNHPENNLTIQPSTISSI
jgi:hypothetical protein